ncbi:MULTISPECIES: permease [unclassified Rhizobium]|uniref:permease n=1 Tax=unclassified Rhizobium TaxID=2613769 RepID=UPI0012E37BC7|nr:MULTISPECIES: permease [unclassified Rhizobium]
MKVLKSLEELLYELVSWLVFYPLTLWRAVTSPLSMMRYADLELADRLEDQYDDVISPPLFLLITLLLAQAVSTLMPKGAAETAAEAALTQSDTNLLLARGVIFGIFPLAMAVTLLVSKGIRITRNTLRPPFFSQCYVAAPFAFLLGLAIDLMLVPGGDSQTAGLAGLGGALLWYGQAQVRWFRLDLGVGLGKATGLFAFAFTIALIAALCVALAAGWGLQHWRS